MSAVRLPALLPPGAMDDPQGADEVAADAAINRMRVEFPQAATARRIELAQLLGAARKHANNLRAKRVANVCSQRSEI